jgi:hypothetical protein
LVFIPDHLLAIDPGNQKCGLAVVTDKAEVVAKMVIPLERLTETISALNRKFPLARILIGDRTNSQNVKERVSRFQLPIETINEDQSTIEGRYRYLKENTRGLARLIPIGLRSPKRPFDDYVAVVLAERYLKKSCAIKDSSVDFKH